MVDILGLAVTGQRESVHAACQVNADAISVSATSLYNKLNGTEPQVARALIRQHASTLCGKTLQGERRRIGRTDTGVVFEQSLEITDPQTDEQLKLRRITVTLTTTTCAIQSHSAAGRSHPTPLGR